MSNPSTTFVLVPGHWHTPTHLTPLTTYLRTHHPTHKIHPIQLASVGLKSSRPTFADDVQAIYNACRNALEAGENVCLMLHSYAGMPGAEAVNRLFAGGTISTNGEDKDAAGKRGGRLTAVVFIAAYTFPAGMVMDTRDFVRPEDPGYSIDNIIANPAHFFFNDLPSSTTQPWVDALEATYYLGRDPCIFSESWRKAPVTALLCRRDNAVPAERQERVWQGTRTEWIDAGHTPYVSRAEEVGEVLVRLAGVQEIGEAGST